MMRRTVAIVLIVSIFGVACSSATLIKSNPLGAKVYIEGKYLGETPVTHSDTAAAGTTRTVLLKKDGFKDTTGTIRKEEFKWGPMFGGLLVLFPFIWVLGYPDEYTFELQKE